MTPALAKTTAVGLTATCLTMLAALVNASANSTETHLLIVAAGACFGFALPILLAAAVLTIVNEGQPEDAPYDGQKWGRWLTSAQFAVLAGLVLSLTIISWWLVIPFGVATFVAVSMLQPWLASAPRGRSPSSNPATGNEDPP